MTDPGLPPRRSSGPRTALRGALALLLTIAIAGCVPASPDADTYDDKARLTLGAVVSQVATVEQLLRTLEDGRMPRPVAVAQMRHSEGSLGTAGDAFGELNPPPTRDRLYERTSELLSDAGDLAAQARIAIEREQRERYGPLADDLQALATKAEELEGRLR